VNAFFHNLSLNLAVANPREAAVARTAFRREPLAYGRKTAIMPENQSLDDFDEVFDRFLDPFLDPFPPEFSRYSETHCAANVRPARAGSWR
jgi:hypothetical protein